MRVVMVQIRLCEQSTCDTVFISPRHQPYKDETKNDKPAALLPLKSEDEMKARCR